MANLKKDALEQLRLAVGAAQTRANTNGLWDLDLATLRTKAQGHPLGHSATGWKNPYPKEDPRSLLLEYQFRSFHDQSRFKANLQARQTGKDFVNQGEIVADCHARPGTEWMIAAPSERQALDSLEQGKRWAEAFELYIKDFKIEREEGPASLLKSAEIHFTNGSRARAVPGKPDTVRGRSANILLTEFDFFENPADTWRAILPSITNPLRGGEKKVRLCTTPNGKGGAMFKIWTKPDTAKMKWSRHFVTLYHAVLMGLPVDIEQLREAMDDAEGFAQECEIQFLDGSTVLLPYELIKLAESILATERQPESYWEAPPSAIRVCGTDFGRTTDPTVNWTLRLQNENWITEEVLVLDGMPSNEQEQVLNRRYRHASAVAFDYTGPGIGLGDYLVTHHGRHDPSDHHFGKIELCTFTQALKREMFPLLRRAFEPPTRLHIPISIEIREDLHAYQQITNNGQHTYTAPRTAAGHSDRATALALAWRATQRATQPGTFRPYTPGGLSGLLSRFRSHARHAQRQRAHRS